MSETLQLTRNFSLVTEESQANLTVLNRHIFPSPVIWVSFKSIYRDYKHTLNTIISIKKERPATKVRFIYILDSSNASSFTFWTSQFTSSCRCNWTGTSPVNWNGSWTDKHSSHFSTAKEMSVKATFFFMCKPQQTNFEMMLKSFWTSHLQMMNGLEPITLFKS